MAIMAAMKNVLSPSSDTKITDIDATNACMKPRSVTNDEDLLSVVDACPLSGT